MAVSCDLKTSHSSGKHTSFVQFLINFLRKWANQNPWEGVCRWGKYSIGKWIWAAQWVLLSGPGLCGRPSTFLLQDPGIHFLRCWKRWLMTVSISENFPWQMGAAEVSPVPRDSPYSMNNKCGVQYAGSICLNWGYLWMDFLVHRTLWGLIEVSLANALQLNFSKLCPVLLPSFPVVPEGRP